MGRETPDLGRRFNMRMWMVDPRFMCGQHLTGEHSEIHKHRHNFAKGHRFDKRVAWNQVEPAAMRERHDLLAAHLKAHRSPYEQPAKHPAYTDAQWGATVDVDAALMLLLTRCPRCRARFREAQAGA